MQLLPTIEYPEDLKRLPRAELDRLCDEMRDFLIESVGTTGGHLSSNLGVVELSVALHYVFDIGPEKDRLVFDVSHQAYPHKILTGRRSRFQSLRMTDGLCGFTSQYESPYDLFHVSHAGTAVSTALGYRLGRRHAGLPAGRTIALVGDAGIGAGLAFEGLFWTRTCSWSSTTTRCPSRSRSALSCATSTRCAPPIAGCRSRAT
jgi:1-deoxy-D-xylulose-5-phosphate synthase